MPDILDLIGYRWRNAKFSQTLYIGLDSSLLSIFVLKISVYTKHKSADLYVDREG